VVRFQFNDAWAPERPVSCMGHSPNSDKLSVDELCQKLAPAPAVPLLQTGHKGQSKG
jgi:hypothetical protein